VSAVDPAGIGEISIQNTYPGDAAVDLFRFDRAVEQRKAGSKLRDEKP
jgi:hypothetical protein